MTAEHQVPPPNPQTLPDGRTPGDLAFSERGGLLPAVVQHHRTGTVLMVGYVDQPALEATLETGLATFFSRSRQEQWVKGATSGNYLHVREIRVDCDLDAVLLRCDPVGPTCHTGADSCFAAGHPQGAAADKEPLLSADGTPNEPQASGPPGSFLAELEHVVAERDRTRPEGSYTTSLLTGGVRRIAQKVGEEGVETALAAVAQEDPELLGESADLLYHLLVLLRARGLGLTDVEDELRRRHG